MAKLILLDGNSLVNRAFYALPLLTTGKGIPTNGIYGFLMMLGRLKEDYNPEYLVVTFDLAAPTFRHEEYQNYKAHRQKMPQDLQVQFPVLKDLLKASGVAYLELAGYEADDLIGTIAVHAEDKGLEVLVVTGDRDTLQLVKGNIKVLLTRRGITETEDFTREKVFEKYGIWPEQVADWKGLMGDASDNIPGVPGIGEKSAVPLLQEYTTLDNLLANLATVKKDKWKNLLTEHRELALLSRKLATIDCKVPIDLKLDEWRYKEPDPKVLRPIYEELEFTSLLSKLPVAEGEETAVNSFASAAVLTENGMLFIENAHQKREICLQFITRGSADFSRDLAGVALNLGTEENVYLPYKPGLAWEGFLSLLDDPEVKKVCHDFKKQAPILHWLGIKDLTDFDDTMVMSYLVNATASRHDLVEAARLHLKLIPSQYGLNGKELPLYTLTEGTDAAWLAGTTMGIITALRRYLQDKITEWNMESLYKEIEIPLTTVLWHMEEQGIAIDGEFLKKLGHDMAIRIEGLEKEIFTFAGKNFNINSPKQLGEVLFGNLGLPLQKKTKTGYSTDAEVLENLAPHHPIVNLIMQYRTLGKLKSTYVDVLPALSRNTSRVHTSFNQAVTATGRLSSSNPNLQNIPIRTEEGREIRKAFIAKDPEYLLLSCDYSQIELRILAHLSNDVHFCEAFREGKDIHTRTAAEIFGLAADEVTPTMRFRAKAVNFGIIYGISGYGLAKDLGIPRKEAENYIANYFLKYAGVKEYLDQLIIEARECGYAKTIMNRRRYLPDLHSRNGNLRAFAERTARNTPIQGSAADLIKLAMVKIWPQLPTCVSSAAMLLQVHDELVFEVHQSQLGVLARLVIKEMEEAFPLQVPLKVDAKYGPNWGEMESLNLRF